MIDSLEDRRYALQFSLNVAIRKHSKKRHFYTLVSRLAQTLSLIAGSAAFGTLLFDQTQPAAIAAAVVTIVGLVNFAWDLPGKGRMHDDIYRRLIALSAQLIKVESLTEKNMRVILSERYLIGADEPTVSRVLSVICHNEEIIARGNGSAQLYPVKWWQYLLCMFVDLPPNIKPLSR